MRVKPNLKTENLTATQLLYTCMQYLGFVPIYNLEAQKIIKKVYSRTISVCIVVLISCSYALNIYFFTTSDNEKKILETLPWAIRLTMVHTINITCIVNQAIYKRKNWNVLLKNIYETEFKGMNAQFCKRRIFFSYFVLIFVIIHVVSVCCRKTDPINIVRYFGESIQDIFMFGTVLLIANIALLIKNRLVFLKEEIVKLIPTNRPMEASNKKVVSLVHLFYKLICLMETYNSIFGLCILMYSGSLLTGLLNSYNMFITKKNPLLSFVDILIITVSRTVIGFYFFACCGTANNEIKNIGNESFYVLHHFKPNEDDAKRLFNLGIHACLKSSCITAANIFDVNLTFFFGILGTVLSYVIVILQFY